MSNKDKLLLKHQDRKTSHILHLLLSVITAGLWIPVWLLVGINNSIERGRIERKIGKLS